MELTRWSLVRVMDGCSWEWKTLFGGSLFLLPMGRVFTIGPRFCLGVLCVCVFCVFGGAGKDKDNPANSGQEARAF
jgi:hypothetical protein